MPRRDEATRRVRDELVRVRGGRACDRKAELAGLLRSAGTLHVLGGGRLALEAASEHPGVARRIYEALLEALGMRAELRLLEPGRGRPRQRFAVWAEGVSLQRLVEAGVLDEGGAPGGPVPRRLVQRRCCVGAFVRGAFLARGSAAAARAAAHLELRFGTEAAAADVAALLERLDVRAGVRAHRGSWVVSVKTVGGVGTVLAAMGAHGAYLDWETGSIWKSVHVEASRLANADAANARRLARAAVAHLEAIEAIDDGPGLGSLPRALCEAAELRRAHPEASLEELARLSDPPVTKPAIADRLRRLVRLADRFEAAGRRR